MATYPYTEPVIYESEYQTSPMVQAYFAATGHTTLLTQIHRADIVTLTTGTLARAATTAGVVTTPANLAMAIHDETAVWTSTTTGASAPPGGGGIGNLFGATPVATATASNLLPAEPGQVHVNLISNGQLVEFSLDKSIAWATAVINTGCYLYLDATSNLFYVSTTAGGGAQFGVIKNVSIHATQGQIGDFGVRVIVQPLATVVI